MCGDEYQIRSSSLLQWLRSLLAVLQKHFSRFLHLVPWGWVHLCCLRAGLCQGSLGCELWG